MSSPVLENPLLGVPLPPGVGGGREPGLVSDNPLLDVPLPPGSSETQRHDHGIVSENPLLDVPLPIDNSNTQTRRPSLGLSDNPLLEISLPEPNITPPSASSAPTKSKSIVARITDSAARRINPTKVAHDQKLKEFIDGLDSKTGITIVGNRLKDNKIKVCVYPRLIDRKTLNVSTDEKLLVTDARWLVDKLCLIDFEAKGMGKDEVLAHLQGIKRSPSEWTGLRDIPSAVAEKVKEFNANKNRRGVDAALNFTSERAAETAQLAEVEKRGLVDTPPFTVERKHSILGQVIDQLCWKVQGNKGGSKKSGRFADSLESMREVLFRALQTNSWEGLFVEENPFKLSADDFESENLHGLLSEDELAELTGVQKLSLKHFSTSIVTAADLDKRQTVANNLEHSPCVQCNCCEWKLFYDSVAQAFRVIQKDMMDHLLACKALKTSQRLALATAKRLAVVDGARLRSRSGNLHEAMPRIIQKICRIEGPHPLVYNHQAQINNANKVAEQCPLARPNPTGLHRSVADIYEQDEMKKLIQLLIVWEAYRRTCPKETKFDHQFIANRFQTIAGIDVQQFRDDWDDQNKKENTVCLGRLMFVYGMRWAQFCCAVCGGARNDDDGVPSRFGGPRESNHLRADGAEPGSEEAATKKFGLSRACCKDRSIIEIVGEFTETQQECYRCHNKFGFGLPWSEMPDSCAGDYSALDGSARLFCEVQETRECKQLHETVVDLQGNLGEMTGDELFERIVEAQSSYRAEDLALCSASEFDAATTKKRGKMLKQIEYYYEKRSIRGCFLCRERIINSPLREFALIDAHHVSEEDKEFNPSDCVDKSLEAGRLERRKCCPLCKGCHTGVHNDDNIAEQLEKMMAERGFKVDRRGGGVITTLTK